MLVVRSVKDIPWLKDIPHKHGHREEVVDEPCEVRADTPHVSQGLRVVPDDVCRCDGVIFHADIIRRLFHF
jgi:hypothetical protein